MVQKIIILIQIITIMILLSLSPQAEQKYFLMTVTAYSLHKDCIADKHNNGLTAMMTPIREGVVAINVDYIDGKWKIRSPLKLGQKIYIEGMGEFSVEDTGYFTDKNYKQDFWNVDVYIKNYNEAVNFGRKLKKVFVINN